MLSPIKYINKTQAIIAVAQTYFAYLCRCEISGGLCLGVLNWYVWPAHLQGFLGTKRQS